MAEQFDARKEMIEMLKDKVRQQIEDEVAGRVPTANFLKLGTKEPSMGVEDIPDADWEVYADIATSQLTDERWRQYEVDLLQAFNQFREVERKEGITVAGMDFPRYWFRAFLNNERSKKK